MPLEREPLFQQFAVEVDINIGDDELVQTLAYWVRSDEERLRRAEHGQFIALSHFTYDDNVDGLIAAYRDVRRNRFGLKFVQPFSLGCSVNGRLKDGANPWFSCDYTYSEGCHAEPLPFFRLPPPSSSSTNQSEP